MFVSSPQNRVQMRYVRLPNRHRYVSIYPDVEAHRFTFFFPRSYVGFALFLHPTYPFIPVDNRLINRFFKY